MTSPGRAALLWALALGGCTSFDAHSLDAHSFDRSAGWHAAQVVAVGRADALATTVDQDCSCGKDSGKDSGGDGSSPRPYAVVRYRNGGVHSRSLGTSRLPAGVPLRVGDAVYVNLRDCKVTLALPAEVDRAAR